MIGTTISHFKILEKLGEGGMGVVYKAEDLKLRRVVALKFLHRHRLGSDTDQIRFLREAQAAASLDHSNICTVHEIVDTPEHTFIVMNYVAGRTLARLIDSGPLDTAAAVDYAIQIAEGLGAAHEKGIIHRDVKSANILVTEAGQIKITDFGLARLRNRTRITRDDTSVGTAAYMSPEQLTGGEVDRHSDIWSLGVVLYEMLAGRLPFRGHHESAVVYATLNEEPEPLSSIRPDTPAALEAVISKALAKNWNNRYHSADELLADLRPVRAAIREGKELPAAVRPKGRVGRSGLLSSRLLRSPVSWIAAISAVAIAAALVVFYPRRAVPFAQRDFIVLADFENLTGEAVFDRSLDTALGVSLDQSPYVNVLPRRRAEDALRRMKKEEVERIDAETAREIALREGVRVLVVPAITGMGERYALTGVIQNARTGENLRSEMVEANGQSEVLAALDELAKRIRSDLGEAKRSISQKSKALEHVTTASLSGLQQYTMGFDKQRSGNFDEARRHYEYALESDSTFAIALGALGILEYQYFDRASGIAHLNRALAYADQTTEPESYSIRAAHAIAVEQDLEQAAQIYRMALETYPDVSTHHNNLGAVYGMLGRHHSAVRQYQEAIRAEPTLMIAYNGMVTEYLDHLGRIDSALVWLRRQMAYQPQSPWPYCNLAWAYVGTDSLDKAVSALERSLQFDPQFVAGLDLLGHARRLQGRYRESVDAFDREYRVNGEEASPLYYAGIVYEVMGDSAKARESYQRFLRATERRAQDEPDNAGYAIELARVLTRLGRAGAAQGAEKKAAAADSTSYIEWARLRAVQGRMDEAFSLLRQAIDGGYRDFLVLKSQPDFRALRGDPRFAALWKRYVFV